MDDADRPGPGGDPIEEVVIALAAGDITRRDDILWRVTPAQAEPWLKYRHRELLFRESVIAFFGGGSEQSPADKYCDACRDAGMADDCSSCSREIEQLPH